MQIDSAKNRNAAFYFETQQFLDLFEIGIFWIYLLEVLNFARFFIDSTMYFISRGT